MSTQSRLYSIGLVALLGLPLAVSAQTLDQFEHQLIQQYVATKPGSRIEADQYNQQIAAAVQRELAGHPESFNYPFKQLQQHGKLFITYSPDRKLKFYSFDVSSGGTMREFETWAQIHSGTQIMTQQLPATSLVQQVKQTTFKNMPVYLVRDLAIGSSREGAYTIQALQLSQQKLKPVQIFQTKTRKLSEITVGYDRAYFPKQAAFENAEQLPEQFIRISKGLKFIDIRLVQPSGALSPQFLRYAKNATAYLYQGRVS